ncbi:neural/ectodermal development factor IMP-L2 isoform X2 [Cardiocondyla obscurior]|uniref:neural/ectodermal development factor IMP-L2 isoform X2 n=1 Tax=Cardiocondyla obscurior TaxID=286306 RepID=UPI0039658321
MRLYVLSLEHLLVLVVVADVALGYLPLFLPNAPLRPNQPGGGAGNKAKNGNVKLGGKKNNRFTTTWTRITQHPPDTVEVAVGSRVELYCEAAGNPPPEVYWLEEKPSESYQMFQKAIVRLEEALSGSVPAQWEGIAHVSSAYVIDCVRPEDQGLKYCVSFSKNVVQTAITALLVNSKGKQWHSGVWPNGHSPRDCLISIALSTGTKVTECSEESQPTITLYQTWRFALIGTTIVLPCRVVGQPKPYLFWIDNVGKTISPATHERHIVLPTGDLQITDIKWEDMGDYACKVQSGYTEKSATTFLYPVVDITEE